MSCAATKEAANKVPDAAGSANYRHCGLQSGPAANTDRCCTKQVLGHALALWQHYNPAPAWHNKDDCAPLVHLPALPLATLSHMLIHPQHRYHNPKVCLLEHNLCISFQGCL